MTVNAAAQDRRELLLRMYQENRCQARHYESVRATVVSFTLAAAVGISALIAKDGLTRKDWPLALVLVVIGIYGAIFTSFYFRRIGCYELMAEEFCNELDLLFGTEETDKQQRTLKVIQDDAMTNYKKKFSNWRELDKVDLFRMFWPITISILAVAAMLLKFTIGWII
jgi:hypothetical protein